MIHCNERQLVRSKIKSRKDIKIRRDQIDHSNGRVNNYSEISIKEYKNELGFYSIPNNTRNKLSREDQFMIKKLTALCKGREKEKIRGLETREAEMMRALLQGKTPWKTVQQKATDSRSQRKWKEYHRVNG